MPVSLFTVNSWVTGERMLSARTTADLLAQRDNTLSAFAGTDVLEQQALEVLSEMHVEIDKKCRKRFKNAG